MRPITSTLPTRAVTDYSSSGWKAEGTSAQRTFTFDWDASTRQITQEISAGQRKADYTYHANGRLHTKTETDLTNGNTRVWTTTYTYHDPGTDSRVKTMAVDGPRAIADTTLYEYSSQGYLTRITNAVGHKTEYQNHNGRGQPGKIIDPNGKVTTLTYTTRGWLDAITQDVGGINAFTDLAYDAVGQLTRVTLPDATYFDYNYDDAHRLEGITNSLGERIEYTLDAAGNPDLISFRDASNTETQAVDYQFDELSRLFRMFGSYGQETRYNYDEKDHLESIDDGVNPPTRQDFDALNRLSTVTDAGGNPASMAYDSQDRIVNVTDQRGLPTDYIYDGFGNLKQMISPDTGITRYTYDEAGNRLSQTDARGIVTNYTYDALNRLKTVTYPAAATENITYTYDSCLLAVACKGRLSSITDSSGQTVYLYDARGNVVAAIQVIGGNQLHGDLCLQPCRQADKCHLSQRAHCELHPGRPGSRQWHHHQAQCWQLRAARGKWHQLPALWAGDRVSAMATACSRCWITIWTTG